MTYDTCPNLHAIKSILCSTPKKYVGLSRDDKVLISISSCDKLLFLQTSSKVVSFCICKKIDGIAKKLMELKLSLLNLSTHTFLFKKKWNLFKFAMFCMQCAKMGIYYNFKAFLII